MLWRYIRTGLWDVAYRKHIYICTIYKIFAYFDQQKTKQNKTENKLQAELSMCALFPGNIY